MKTTLKDIARECGVSLGTVSDVLHNKGNFKPETRKLVMDAVERLNYRPNSSISLLEKNRTRSIGLVVPGLNSVYTIINDAIRYFKILGRDSGLECVLYELEDIRRKLESNTNDGNPFVTDALIFFTPFWDYDKVIEGVKARNIQVALIRRHTTVPGVPMISDSDYVGARRVMEHLYGLGHRRFGLIVRSGRNLDERTNGCRDFISEKGLETDPAFIFDTLDNQDPDIFDTWLTGVLKAENHPTAFFCFQDQQALILINNLQRRGVRVPEDIAVTGYDNDSLGQVLRPHLTTVAIPTENMIRLACKTLLGFMDGDPITGMKVEVENRLIVRESCGALLKK